MSSTRPSKQMPGFQAILARMRRVEELGVVVGAPGADREVQAQAVTGKPAAQEFGAITSADASQARSPYSSSSPGLTQGQLLAIHEYGSPERNIPERSVLRSTLQEQRARALSLLAEDVKANLANTSVPVQRFFLRIAVLLEGEVKKKFGSADLAPLSPATIARKGSSKPLIDTGSLRASIEGRVIELKELQGGEQR